jgi:hypothetical protein
VVTTSPSSCLIIQANCDSALAFDTQSVAPRSAPPIREPPPCRARAGRPAYTLPHNQSLPRPTCAHLELRPPDRRVVLQHFTSHSFSATDGERT